MSNCNHQTWNRRSSLPSKELTAQCLLFALAWDNQFPTVCDFDFSKWPAVGVHLLVFYFSHQVPFRQYLSKHYMHPANEKYPHQSATLQMTGCFRYPASTKCSFNPSALKNCSVQEMGGWGNQPTSAHVCIQISAGAITYIVSVCKMNGSERWTG